MGSRYTIGIAGGGIGGLAAAAFLARVGHNVQVFDQFEAPSPVGSGLVIQPVGQAVLNALGAGDHARTLGHRINFMTGTEATSGRQVLNVGYGGPKDSRFGLGIHRASLFYVVYQAAIEAGASVVTDAPVVGSEIVGNGRTLELDKDRSTGPFDLVIDASGATSPLSPVKSKALSYGALWGTVDTVNSGDLPVDALCQCYRKASKMAGVLPIGYLPSGQAHKTAIFWSMPVADIDIWTQGDFNTWRDEVNRFWPAFAPYTDQLNGSEDLTIARYTHGSLQNPVRDRLVFIGDAAHRASPQLGQGANMALLDAFVLADALRRLDIPGALQEYALMRRWHVRIYQMVSAMFTPFYQSDSSVLPWLRDWVLAPASQVPPVRAILRRLVCGELVTSGALVQSELDRLMPPEAP